MGSTSARTNVRAYGDLYEPCFLNITSTFLTHPTIHSPTLPPDRLQRPQEDVEGLQGARSHDLSGAVHAHANQLRGGARDSSATAVAARGGSNALVIVFIINYYYINCSYLLGAMPFAKCGAM